MDAAAPPAGEVDAVIAQNRAAAGEDATRTTQPIRPTQTETASYCASVLATGTSLSLVVAGCCCACCWWLASPVLQILFRVMKVAGTIVLAMSQAAIRVITEEIAPFVDEEFPRTFREIKRSIYVRLRACARATWHSAGLLVQQMASSVYSAFICILRRSPVVRCAFSVAEQCFEYVSHTAGPALLVLCQNQMQAWQAQYGKEDTLKIVNVFSVLALLLCSNFSSALWWLGVLCATPQIILRTLPEPREEDELEPEEGARHGQPNTLGPCEVCLAGLPANNGPTAGPSGHVLCPGCMADLQAAATPGDQPPVLQPCPVCYDSLPNTAAVPCGHLLCEACMARVQRSNAANRAPCPTCNQRITGTMRVYLP